MTLVTHQTGPEATGAAPAGGRRLQIDKELYFSMLPIGPQPAP